MDLQKIEKCPEVGDYVFCSQWSDRSPSDPWNIGILKEITENGHFIVEGSNRAYRNCQVVSHLQGILILGFYPSLEGSDWRGWKSRVKSLSDQNVIDFFNWFLKPSEEDYQD